MKQIAIKLSIKELELVITLAADQLFQREFIEPRMPGYKSNAGEISLGKAPAMRLRLLLEPGSYV